MTAANLKDPRFTGVFTAITTPFTPDGSRLDADRLAEQLQSQKEGGVRGVVICGTTGESPTLEEDEYRDLVTRGVDRAKRLGLVAVVGTGSNSTAHAVEMQKFAAGVGADGALSVNPYYNKPTQEGLYRHFVTVADAADLPVMLYNVPGRSGVALAPATVARLAEHPRIVAIKEATGSPDSASEIAMRCPRLALLSGDDSMTLPFMAVGAVGVVSVLANIIPDKLARLCAAFAAGRHDEALALHRDLFGICRALFAETNPIPVKAAMKLLGRDSGAVRLPMTEASEATVAQLRQVLTAQGLLKL